MYQCTSCSTSEVHDGWKDEGGKDASGQVTCGLTYIWQVDSQNHIEQTTIMYNNNGQAPWWDGPPASGQSGCDAKATAFHEEGHVFGLGHSSVKADVMYWKGGDVNTVSSNAQTGLNAIYGPYQGQNGSSDGAGCGTCQIDPGGSLPVPIPTCNGGALGACNKLEGYLAKAWDMSQGVPYPNPVSELIGADGCLQYFIAKDYTSWLNCQSGVSGL
jgi:hypothetical protein